MLSEMKGERASYLTGGVAPFTFFFCWCQNKVMAVYWCLCTCQGADDADHGRDSGHGVGEEKDRDSDHDHPGEQNGLQTLTEDGQVLVRVQEVVVENIGLHVLIAKEKQGFRLHNQEKIQ